MYLDSVCDGILKGLDQQLFTFRTAIVDSLLRIGMIVFMLPRWGIWGFITVMYISNLLTCMLNVRRLLKCSNAHIPLCKNFIIPLLASLTIVLLADCFLSALTHLPNLVYIILICIISLTAYTTVLFVTKAVDRDLIMTFKK
jgi:stage V sporulation protein B